MRHFLIDVTCISGLWAAAVTVVPRIHISLLRMNWGLDTPDVKWVWLTTLLLFVGVPTLVGILRSQQPTLFSVWVALGWLAACPVVYVITDPMPEAYERLRDAFFLGTASTTELASAMWTASHLRKHQWGRMVGAGFLLIVAAGAAMVMLSLFIYLERCTDSAATLNRADVG